MSLNNVSNLLGYLFKHPLSSFVQICLDKILWYVGDGVHKFHKMCLFFPPQITSSYKLSKKSIQTSRTTRFRFMCGMRMATFPEILNPLKALGCVRFGNAFVCFINHSH